MTMTNENLDMAINESLEHLRSFLESPRPRYDSFEATMRGISRRYEVDYRILLDALSTALRSLQSGEPR